MPSCSLISRPVAAYAARSSADHSPAQYVIRNSGVDVVTFMESCWGDNLFGMQAVRPMGDIYWGRDFPVLLAIARWELDEGRPGTYVNPVLLMQSVADLSLTRKEQVEVVGRLFRADLVRAKRVSGHDIGGEGIHEDFIIEGLTPAGLSEVGSYPKSSSLAAMLTVVLQHQATELERTDPAKGQKVRTILHELGDLGTDFAAKLAAVRFAPCRED